MPIPIEHPDNRTPAATWVKLRQLIIEHPGALIVTTHTDAEYSKCGEEGQLFSVRYDANLDKIELEFD